MVEISHEEFETLVDEALAAIPDPVADRITNLAFLISDYAEESPYILGQYHGVALTERTFDHTGFLPDTITIYREALKDFCNSREELVEQVRVTVMHEIGHYFGLDEDDLHRLGYA
ncbi:metallopeptidase family protein [Corynebacterium diphtheriae]|uniref:metallopeptidase family protein n=1 Tax=Corynebacterium diphtheriae TaxID=1717 RepID=UPI0013C8FA21|nr:metallopeptidase family protein [Corynebacterium diphtheriae]MBG9276391.1 metallopeptidase family protein [Corynebacterium diphtheriae bv. mitis]MBG9280835.1 metallopeptidase family protein [Corynebacterium diphtheriae bv. mitis]MBG9292921.1 metallopeptidase family protein [Corynebacterium diphtheriae bv. gravis]MBG9374437.1 metallopeptidase family protein [Corynebacterium diphtheriae bv. gravis]CAB0714241.1 metallopeptidase family protein [Corynebacterium diphtheriae]